MPRELFIVLVVVIGAGVAVLAKVSLPLPAGISLGPIAFWIVLTLIASYGRVQLPGGLQAHLNTATLIAAVFDQSLPNPFAVCWIAFIGTLELRDFRRVIPWYGTLLNRSNFVLSAFGAWLTLTLTKPWVRPDDAWGTLAQVAIVGAAFALTNNLLSVLVLSIRDHSPFSKIWAVSIS